MATLASPPIADVGSRLVDFIVTISLGCLFLFSVAYTVAHNFFVALCRPICRPYIKLYQKVRASEYRLDAKTPNPY